MLRFISDTQTASRLTGPTAADRMVRVLQNAPQLAARELGLTTVLVSRVYEDGTWRPWSATGIDVVRTPELVAWRATGPGTASGQSSADDEVDPLVRRVLAQNWLLAPITDGDELVGFFHADDPGSGQSGPFFRSCDQDRWGRLVALGAGLFRTRISA